MEEDYGNIFLKGKESARIDVSLWRQKHIEEEELLQYIMGNKHSWMLIFEYSLRDNPAQYIKLLIWLFIH